MRTYYLASSFHVGKTIIKKINTPSPKHAPKKQDKVFKPYLVSWLMSLSNGLKLITLSLCF